MRVALLPSSFFPAVGGVEELTRRLALQLADDGHSVEVWTSRSGAAVPERDVVDGIPVVRSSFPAPRADLRSLTRFGVRGPLQLLCLVQEVRRFRPDVLHVQCFSTNGAYAFALGAVMRIPLVISLQGETVMDDHDIYQHSLFLRLTLRQALRRAAAVTGCSQFTVDDAVRRFGLPAVKGQVVFNGVDLGESAPEPFFVPFGRFVLALGRAVENKGFDLLLRAWAGAAGVSPGVGLVIGGDGAQLPYLRRLVIELGLQDSVYLPGHVTRGGVAWAMSNAELFVMPSRVEPFGIVALEAWRAGTAIVVSNRGGASEFVTHETDGLVVDPFDPMGLTSALTRVLQDTFLRRRLAEAGRRRVPDFRWSVLSSKYVDIYERALRAAASDA